MVVETETMGDACDRRWWRHLKQESKCGAFVAVGCQRGVYVRHDQAVPAVSLRNWEDLSAKESDQILWPGFIDRPATESSVCVGESCRSTTMSISPRPVEQILFVRPGIVDQFAFIVC